MCRCRHDTQHAPTEHSAEWLNDAGRVVHPAAPLGVGGPGAFRSPGVFASDDGNELLPHPRSPAVKIVDPALVKQADELQAAKVVRQAPPKVAADSTEVIRGISVTLKKDGTGPVNKVGDAKTDIISTPTGKVTYQADAKNIVTSVSNNLTWAVTIVTLYGAGKPEDDSAYGRGTTKEDKEAGNVTLGFHEACHRNDLMNYLRNTAVPVLGAKKDQSTTEANKEIDKYMKAWAAYFQAARDGTITSTDEVGDPTMSEFDAAE
ncbi:hypothetical protein [Piscinibacter sakaiensis]|uniref:hypothetical protein n=1 Tax=Piscinibacter sakaiensis TaxID=1547922 RepID=UPI003AAAEE22